MFDVVCCFIVVAKKEEGDMVVAKGYSFTLNSRPFPDR